MVRKLRRLCVLVLLLMALPLAALAAPSVVDNAGLFTEREIQQMEEIITDIQTTYQMDVVVLTSRSVWDDTQDFADLYYERNGYGMGEDDAGLLYLIDMRNRVPCISTSGAMIDYITDRRLNDLFDRSYDSLKAGRYGQAALIVLERLQDILRQGRQEGSFRSDAETGKRLSGVYNTLTRSEMLLGAAVAAAVALVMYLTVLKRYSLKNRPYHFSAGVEVSRVLKADDEVFLRQDVVRVRNPDPSSGGGNSGGNGGGLGSGVHTSSSGGTHGGGVGRGF